MRLVTSYLFRAVCALIVGFLLVSNPSEMTSVLVQVIGGLFALSGLAAIISYYTTSYHLRRTRQQLAALADVSSADIRLPSPSTISLVVGLGSICLGAFLIAEPGLFVHILMYVLGALLLLLGLYQIASLISFRRVAPISASLFLSPVLVMVAGAFVIFYPDLAAALPFVILGVAYILYGVAEFLYGLRLGRFQRRLARQQASIPEVSDAAIQDAVIVEEEE